MEEQTVVERRERLETWRRVPGWFRSLPFVSGRGVFEVALIGSIYLVYIAIRGAVRGREGEALERALDVVDIEKWMHLYHEEALQDVLLNSEPFIVFLNIMYFAGHFPPLLIFAFWIFRADRAKYTMIRTTFLISAAIGLAIYWAIPTTPPRLLPESFGFVDTLSEYGPFSAYDVQGNDPFVNEHAAIPSLHFGWAALLAIGYAWSIDWRWYGVAAAIGWPIMTIIIIEGTANHFFLDAVAGALVVVVAYALARWLHDRVGGRLSALV